MKKKIDLLKLIIFKIQDKLKEKNPRIMQLEENKEKSLNEIFLQIPASCYIDLFSSLDEQTFSGLGKLFRSILTEEIDSVPRRAVSFAKEKLYSQDDQQMAQKSFYDLVRNYLSDEYKVDLQKIEKKDGFEILSILFQKN